MSWNGDGSLFGPQFHCPAHTIYSFIVSNDEYIAAYIVSVLALRITESNGV